MNNEILTTGSRELEVVRLTEKTRAYAVQVRLDRLRQLVPDGRIHRNAGLCGDLRPLPHRARRHRGHAGGMIGVRSGSECDEADDLPSLER